MTKRNVLFGLILLLFTLAASGCGLLRDPAGPSGEPEAVPVEVSDPEPVVEEEAEPEQTVEDEAPPPGSVTVYTIEPLDSKARFELNEVLRSEPKTVVGVTDQVSGEIAVDLADLSTAKVGKIRINARTLATDNNFRNRAINNEILDSGEFEFITFTPTETGGLPASTAVGDEVEFTITGDLTIRDITQPVTFDVRAVPVSDTQIEGSASTVVQRADFNLTIPSVPNVADVEEEVELYIDFVANAS